MSYLFKDLFPKEFSNFEKYFIGSDKISDAFQKNFKDLSDITAKTLSNYPPFNIKKIDDNKYVIEMAVAGFSKQDIEITLEEGKLVVKGLHQTMDDLLKDGIEPVYLFRGISDRAFTRHFLIQDTIEVKNADLVNGMLKIWLEAIIPEHKKPKKIPVNETIPTTSKQFLAEEK